MDCLGKRRLHWKGCRRNWVTRFHRRGNRSSNTYCHVVSRALSMTFCGCSIITPAKCRVISFYANMYCAVLWVFGVVAGFGAEDHNALFGQRGHQYASGQ